MPHFIRFVCQPIYGKSMANRDHRLPIGCPSVLPMSYLVRSHHSNENGAIGITQDSQRALRKVDTTGDRRFKGVSQIMPPNSRSKVEVKTQSQM